MSRVTYGEEEDFPGQRALWDHNLKRSLEGAKGQAALRDLEAALLALPAKRLIADHVAKDGEMCAVGAVVAHRRVSLGKAREAVLKELEAETEPTAEDLEFRADWEEEGVGEGVTEAVGVEAGIPRLVAWRLVALNDIDLDYCTPEERYARVLKWTRAHLRAAPDDTGEHSP